MAKEYALYKGDELLSVGTAKELAKEMGVGVTTIRHYGTKAYAERMKGCVAPRRLVELETEYALYKGDELLSVGTLEEISYQMGVSEDSLSFYGSPSYARRTSETNGRRLVKLEHDFE